MEVRLPDEPPEPESWGDVPPWELHGEFRRDGEPHRSNQLWLLGIIALLAGFCTLALAFLSVGLLFLPGSLPLGLLVWANASRDLARMRQRLMDPSGQVLAEEARHFGCTAVWLGLIGAFFALPWLLIGARSWKW